MSVRWGMALCAAALLPACATTPTEALLALPEGCTADGVLAAVPALRSAGLYALQADLRDGRVIASRVRSVEPPRTDDPPAPRPTSDNPFPNSPPRASSLPFRSISQHIKGMRCPGMANIEALVQIGPDSAGYRRIKLTPLVDGVEPKRMVQPPR
jgi:hypothetical protein